jgi:hypothetical protein
MTEDTATAQVMILYGAELIGVREFSVSKTKQGEEAVSCYVYSSLGNLFEESQEDNTVLTAYIYRGEVEIDPEGSELEYLWYIYEKNNSQVVLPLENIKTKQITIPVKDLIDKNVYFIA